MEATVACSPWPELRGHSETEGNLVQLLVAWAKECSALKAWLQDKSTSVIT